MYSKKSKTIFLLIFLVLPVTHLIVFSYIPILFNVYLSFTNWNGVGFENIEMVGLDNYKKIFTDPKYIAIFKNCLYYLISSIPQRIIALGLALVVTGKMRGINVFKGIIILPYLLNGIIISTIFTIFFNPSGTLNFVLEAIGLGVLKQNWLQDLSLVNPSLAFISIWRYYGVSFLMFYGALQAVPEEIYQAAAIDGCNKWKEIRYICIPYIKPVIFISMITAISGSIQVFEIPYIMLKGANGSSTPVILINQSMTQSMYGFAAALSVVVFFVVVASVLLQRALVKED